MNIDSKYIRLAIELLFLLVVLGTPLYRLFKGIFLSIKYRWFPNLHVKQQAKKEGIKVNSEEWMKKVYDTISEVNLWSHKLSYDDYLKAIEKHSKEFYVLVII